MRRDLFKGFIKRHWKKIILIVILLMTSYKAYADYVRADQRVKEAEEVVIMKWFGPRVRYEMIQEWNENGVRGWGNWSEETCDRIEEAIKADESEDERIRSNALALLNGGSGTNEELNVCAMDVNEFLHAIEYIEDIGKNIYNGEKDKLTDGIGEDITNGSIRKMWI